MSKKAVRREASGAICEYLLVSRECEARSDTKLIHIVKISSQKVEGKNNGTLQ